MRVETKTFGTADLKHIRYARTTINWVTNSVFSSNCVMRGISIVATTVYAVVLHCRNLLQNSFAFVSHFQTLYLGQWLYFFMKSNVSGVWSVLFGYNENGCLSVQILLTDVWWWNRSGKITCYTMNKSKNTIEKNICRCSYLKFSPEHTMLNSDMIFFFP